MDLCTAAKTGTVGELGQALNNGADINYQDAVFGRTPLSWAATSGNGEAVRLLLAQEGINLNLKDNGGRTPLSWTVEKGSKSIVCLLLQKDSIGPNSNDNIGLNSKDNSGRTPLSWAVKKGNKEVVELLLRRESIELNSKDSDGQTPLLLAAKMGHDDIVELLVERHGIELNSQDNGGRTALSWAAAEEEREYIWWRDQDVNEKVVRLLLKKVSIDLNLKDNSGRTALSWAAEKGNKRVVSLLLNEKDRINQRLKDYDGRSPLSFAAANNHKAVIKLLADNDPLILHTLIQEKRKSLVQALLNEKYVKSDAQDPLGKTPMHIAIAGGHFEVATSLMLHGATDINLKDNDGITPLRLAMRLPSQTTLCIIERLLKKSAVTEDIMADEWQEAYKAQLSDVVILSDRANGEKSVRFIAEEELDRETPRIETGRRRL
jgi:ankyrin repeat protein